MLATGRSRRCNAPGPPLPTSSPAGREHAPAQHTKRDPGFSLVAIQEHFAFCPDWYRRGDARDLALAYYFILRGVLRSRLHLRAYLVRCRHCRIFFLTHPRNRGRQDLGCPFGCADAHRKEQSAKRSTAYYQTPAGKVKKARLNGKRGRAGDPGSEPGEVSARIEVDEIQLSAKTESEEIQLPAGIVEHVRVVTTLIEGFPVGPEEVVSMLERVVRQRRFVGGKPDDYVLRGLAKSSPREASNGT